MSQDFFPRIGGAHLWLYEVYRRWPTPVTWLTSTPAVLQCSKSATCGVERTDLGALQVHRTLRAVNDIEIRSIKCWQEFLSSTGMALTHADGCPSRFHCLRAFPEGFIGYLARKRLGHLARLVVYAHGEEMLVARASRQVLWMAQKVYQSADLVIANSHSTASMVRELAPGATVVVINPGVDVASFRCDPVDVEVTRRGWGWVDGTIVVSTVARMEPRKNQRSVLSAIASLRSEGQEVAYVCAGSGEELEHLEAQTATLGLREFVRFPGVLSESEKVLTYLASDIYAMPSIRVGEMTEGFGIVFLEAAAANRASLAGSVGGQPEAVIDGETGIIVDGSSDDSVLLGLRRLVKSSELRARLGKRGRSWAEAHDWSKVAERTLQAVRGSD